MGYKINLETKITIKVENTNFRKITFIFLYAIRELFEEYVTKILLHYFEEYYKRGQLEKILGVQKVMKKTALMNLKAMAQEYKQKIVGNVVANKKKYFKRKKMGSCILLVYQ